MAKRFTALPLLTMLLSTVLTVYAVCGAAGVLVLAVHHVTTWVQAR